MLSRSRLMPITALAGLVTALCAVIPAAGAPTGLPRHPPPFPAGEGAAGPPALMPGGQVAAPPPTATPVISTGCPLAPYGPRYYAPGAGKTVALTFDDGPGASTAQLRSVLVRYGVTATFFNLGQNAAARLSQVQAEARAAYPLGNHTWDHPDLTRLTAARQAAEMDQASAEQQIQVGARPCVFRPPGGSYNSTTLSLAQQRRMSVWLWSVDTEDWKAEGSGSAYWVNRIIRLAEQQGGHQSHPVILMHNQPVGNPATVAALPAIINYFRSHGYTFVDLYDRTGDGYQVVTSDGAAHAFGAPAAGSLAGRLSSGVHAVGLAANPFSAGYWILTSNGAVTGFGAPWYGSLYRKVPSGQSVTALAAARGGYQVLTSGGAVHSFGTAGHGSLAGKLAAGVRAVDLAADPATGGYWILTSNGAVTGFAAPWYGSLYGKVPPRVSVTAIAASPSSGYLVLTSDGGVHAFRTAWYGSLMDKLATGVRAIGLAVDPASTGYWILTSDGAVTAFHAPWHGSLYRGIPAGRSVVAMAGE